MSTFTAFRYVTIIIDKDWTARAFFWEKDKTCKEACPCATLRHECALKWRKVKLWAEAWAETGALPGGEE